jgi:hypothetical protein
MEFLNLASHSDKLLALILMISLSIGIRILLQISGQRWITTTAHTATLVLLPIITYTITKVISGNIALSLGMVGALSIVRFRNPVRSPLELSVYFGSITMGIAASVNIVWLLFLFGSITFATSILYLLNLVSSRFFKQPFFNASFSEGNTLSTLEINTSSPIKILDDHKLTTIKKHDLDSTQYTIVSSRIDDLNKILSLVEDDSKLLSYQLKR